MHGKGVNEVPVLTKAEMNFLIHRVELGTIFIVVEITCVDNAQAGRRHFHNSLRPFFARCISYILTSFSQRLMAMTAAQANP